MEELEFLRSPYLQELPISWLDGLVNVKLNKFNILLLDILKQDLYIIDIDTKKRYRPLKTTDKKNCLNNQTTPNNEFFNEYTYYGLEIEINSNCNYSCGFCPVSLKRQQAVQFMSLTNYKHIINEAKTNGIKEVSLSSYSEPTLSPHFLEAVFFAVQRGLIVVVFTNGSMLNNSLVSELSKVSDKIMIYINFPEYKENEYMSTTKSELYSKVVSNINHASKLLNLQIIINNPKTEVIHGITKLFPQTPVQQWEIDDRAGAIPNTKYAKQQFHRGRINGCPLAARFLNVSINGDVLLCAQDYFGKNTFGNILNSSLFDILNGPTIRQYRRWIFGAEYPPKDFICRRCRWTRSNNNDFSVGTELRAIDINYYKSILTKNKIIKIINEKEKFEFLIIQT